jgi:predicted DCC family thiol-disulfide oxidoreductase YuxK
LAAPQAPDHDRSDRALTVWFDGACPLCQREIAMMRWLDWHQAIRFVDVSPAGGEAATCPIDRADLLARFHAREGGSKGELLSGAAAFAAMWRAVPLLRPLGLAARNRTVLMLLERAYRAFLRVRPRLQRWLGGSGAISR